MAATRREHPWASFITGLATLAVGCCGGLVLLCALLAANIVGCGDPSGDPSITGTRAVVVQVGAMGALLPLLGALWQIPGIDDGRRDAFAAAPWLAGSATVSVVVFCIIDAAV